MTEPAGHVFGEHTIESAPASSRRFMTATANSLGYLPSATARWAASPQLLDGFAKLNGLFDATTLDPIAREVVVMTMARRNRCDICVAMHTARLVALGADAATITALRGGVPLGAGAPAGGETEGDEPEGDEPGDGALLGAGATLGDGRPLGDPRLEAVRVFTLRVLDSAGDVGEAALREFLGHGYTARNALEVVLGIGTYTMSTLANRLTGAAVDEPLREFA
ncbi:MAG TPA: carboxymuconolactone decarboxylase family protein [Trebonia sp.]